VGTDWTIPEWTAQVGRVGDGEDDDVVGHSECRVLLAELLDGVTTVGRDVGQSTCAKWQST
jgi:hypothetical protein